MGKFCVRDLIGSGTQVRSAEDLKVHFNLLVDTFSFTIRLRVVGSGKREVVVQEFFKLLGKGRGELWAMV